MSMAPDSSSKTPVTSRLSFLLVDDSDELCRTLKTYLGRRGCDVRTCRDVSSARIALANEEADVLLTDFFIHEETCESLVAWALEEGRVQIAYCMSGAVTNETI